jgi:YggT family protein
VLIALAIVNVLLIAYILILMLRIVLGWFAPRALGRAWDFLTAVTDPYLNLFGHIRFLRGTMFDFSPIAAIITIVVVQTLVNQLLEWGRITLGFFLAAVVSAAWSGARFFLLFFLVVGVLRTIPFIFRATAGASLWKVVDMIMQPVVAWVMRLFRLGRRSGYIQHLLLTIGLVFVAWLLGELLIAKIVDLLRMLPI